MARVGDPRQRSCKNAGTGGFALADNNATTPIAVALVDTDGMAYPDIKPTVKKANVATDVIYGKFVGFDVGSNEVTVAVGGIQSFKKITGTDVEAADIGKGIIATTTAGEVDTHVDQVTPANSGNQGTGVVIGRSGTDILWVDLSAGSRGVV